MNLIKDLVYLRKISKDKVNPFLAEVSPAGVKDGIHFVVSSQMVLNVCNVYTGAYATINSFTGDPCIVYSEDLDTMPEYIKDAILTHEEGHLRLGHVERFIEKQKRILAKAEGSPFKVVFWHTVNGIVNRRKIQDEYEADQYAFDQGADIVGALRYLRDNARYPSGAQKEIDKRIKRLQEVNGV